MTDEKLNQILRQALAPEINDAEWKIIGKEGKEVMNMNEIGRKKRGWKYFPAAVAAAALLMVTSVSAYATWMHLSAREVAIQEGDELLAQEFEVNNQIEEIETQHFGEYDVTLLGVVSGNEISEYLVKDDQGGIDGNKTYIAVAISKTDGSPMPDNQSDDFDPSQFFVSPYIRGLSPVKYNTYSMGGGFTCFVSEGIQYRLLEIDNVECFADRGIYVGVSEGMAYNGRAYVYDKESGALTRNEEFDGVNALFVLPIDPSRGDAQKSQQMIEAMDRAMED